MVKLLHHIALIGSLNEERFLKAVSLINTELFLWITHQKPD